LAESAAKFSKQGDIYEENIALVSARSAVARERFIVAGSTGERRDRESYLGAGR
jgi:hypothetical protein